MKKIAVYLPLIVLFVFAGEACVFGYGGEDHADEKPKTTASGAGTISHTARLGVYEVMFKHPAFEPDAADAPGKEILHPLAVVIGGILPSTLLD